MKHPNLTNWHTGSYLSPQGNCLIRIVSSFTRQNTVCGGTLCSYIPPQMYHLPISFELHRFTETELLAPRSSCYPFSSPLWHPPNSQFRNVSKLDNLIHFFPQISYPITGKHCHFCIQNIFSIPLLCSPDNHSGTNVSCAGTLNRLLSDCYSSLFHNL